MYPIKYYTRIRRHMVTQKTLWVDWLGEKHVQLYSRRGRVLFLAKMLKKKVNL